MKKSSTPKREYKSEIRKLDQLVAAINAGGHQTHEDVVKRSGDVLSQRSEEG